MIDFRYHLISIVAIFLALAAGITLGAGPFHDPVNAQFAAEQDRNQASEAQLQNQLDSAKSAQSFDNAFAGAVGGGMISGKLKDHSVTLFVLPGADDGAADGIADKIKAAGGSVNGTVTLTDKAVNPQERQFADGVARQSLSGKHDIPDTSGMSSYQLLGTGLGRAYLTKNSDHDFDKTASTIASAYREAGFVSGDKDPGNRSDLAVFVTGGADDTSEEGEDELIATLAGAADATSYGVVVAGPPEAADDGGVIAYVRGGDLAGTISSVNADTVTAGRLVTVLALRHELDGKSGQFGTGDGADGTLPG